MPPETAAWVARTPYRELVGSLNYIAVATRPDIAYAAGHLASFLGCYRPEDWTAAIRVLGYLKGTRALFLVLGGTNPLTLVGYSIQVRGFVVGLQNFGQAQRRHTGYCMQDFFVHMGSPRKI